MANLDETISIGGDVEIYVPKTAQGVVGREPAESNYRAFSLARGIYRIENISERPELLIATTRSPARACNSICLAKT